MKTKRILTSVLLSVLVLASSLAIAQPKNGQRGQCDKAQRGAKDKMACLNLTEDQQATAETFFTEMQKEMTPLKLDLKEKKVQLDKLMIADQPDEKDIDAKLEEMSAIRLEMQKLKIDHQLKLRTILDADQKVLFDAQQTGKRNGQSRKGQSKKGKNQAECKR